MCFGFVNNCFEHSISFIVWGLATLGIIIHNKQNSHEHWLTINIITQTFVKHFYTPSVPDAAKLENASKYAESNLYRFEYLKVKIRLL